jgi:ankyrin repeat protein
MGHNWGNMFLKRVIIRGRPEKLKSLLAQGRLGPNSVDAINLLLDYTRDGRTELVRVLLAAGADPNFEFKGRITLLMAASTLKHLDIVRALLAAGADPNLLDEKGQSPLDYALRASLPIANVLIEAGTMPTKHSLYRAITTRNFQIAAALLKAGADPNITLHGMPALPYVVRGEATLDLVKEFLARGADPNEKGQGEDDHPPLTYAVMRDKVDPEVIEALLGAGARVDMCVGWAREKLRNMGYKA